MLTVFLRPLTVASFLHFLKYVFTEADGPQVGQWQLQWPNQLKSILSGIELATDLSSQQSLTCYINPTQ